MPPSSLFQNLPLPNLPIHTSSHPSSLPAFIYGTAWKAEKTADFVYQAISAGFRAIDTAAQPKHYREDLVGEGVRRAVEEVGGREKIWVCVLEFLGEQDWLGKEEGLLWIVLLTCPNINSQIGRSKPSSLRSRVKIPITYHTIPNSAYPSKSIPPSPPRFIISGRPLAVPHPNPPSSTA